MHTDVRFIEKSKKRNNFVFSRNSFYIASGCLYLIGRIRLICNISLLVTQVNRKNIGDSSIGSILLECCGIRPMKIIL